MPPHAAAPRRCASARPTDPALTSIGRAHPPPRSRGVAGGAVVQGELRVGDDVEIRPGIVRRGGDGGVPHDARCGRAWRRSTPKQRRSSAVPGGLIGVGTSLDRRYQDDRIRARSSGGWASCRQSGRSSSSARRRSPSAARAAEAAAVATAAATAAAAAATARARRRRRGLGAQRAADAEKGRAGAGGRAPPRLHRSCSCPAVVRKRLTGGRLAAPGLARVASVGDMAALSREVDGSGGCTGRPRCSVAWRSSGGALARRRRRRRQGGGGWGDAGNETAVEEAAAAVEETTEGRIG